MTGHRSGRTWIGRAPIGDLISSFCRSGCLASKTWIGRNHFFRVRHPGTGHERRARRVVWRGLAPKLSSWIAAMWSSSLSGDTGVGGAAIVDGHALRGRTGRAGHFGHISLNPEGRSLISPAHPGALKMRSATARFRRVRAWTFFLHLRRACSPRLAKTGRWKPATYGFHLRIRRAGCGHCLAHQRAGSRSSRFSAAASLRQARHCFVRCASFLTGLSGDRVVLESASCGPNWEIVRELHGGRLAKLSRPFHLRRSLDKPILHRCSKPSPAQTRFFKKSRELLEIVERQLPQIQAAADWIARSILASRMVHVIFGSATAGSWIEEMWPRYGSFPKVFNPIVELSHKASPINQVVGQPMAAPERCFSKNAIGPG